MISWIMTFHEQDNLNLNGYGIGDALITGYITILSRV